MKKKIGSEIFTGEFFPSPVKLLFWKDQLQYVVTDTVLSDSIYTDRIQIQRIQNFLIHFDDL